MFAVKKYPKDPYPMLMNTKPKLRIKQERNKWKFFVEYKGNNVEIKPANNNVEQNWQELIIDLGETRSNAIELQLVTIAEADARIATIVEKAFESATQ